jgi:hypothetical protein
VAVFIALSTKTMDKNSSKTPANRRDEAHFVDVVTKIHENVE